MLKNISVNVNNLSFYFNMFAVPMESKKIETLLKDLVTEIKGMRSDIQEKQTEACSPDRALRILGLTNRRMLKYFVEEGLLNRRKGGTSYIYFRSECVALADRIGQNKVIVPSQKDLYGNN